MRIEVRDQLLPQAADDDIHRPFIGYEDLRVQRRNNLIARVHAPRLLQQKREQREFARRESHARPRKVQDALLKIEAEQLLTTGPHWLREGPLAEESSHLGCQERYIRLLTEVPVDIQARHRHRELSIGLARHGDERQIGAEEHKPAHELLKEPARPRPFARNVGSENRRGAHRSGSRHGRELAYHSDCETGSLQTDHQALAAFPVGMPEQDSVHP